MLQSSISIIGLAFDLLGFSVLAFEWWRQWIQRDYENELTNAIRMWNFVQRHQPEAKDIKEFIKNEKFASEVRDWTEELKQGAEDAIAARKSAFRFAFALILFGFVLQILGNWPGGIPSISIYPASTQIIDRSAPFVDFSNVSTQTYIPNLRYKKILPPSF